MKSTVSTMITVFNNKNSKSTITFTCQTKCSVSPENVCKCSFMFSKFSAGESDTLLKFHAVIASSHILKLITKYDTDQSNKTKCELLVKHSIF